MLPLRQPRVFARLAHRQICNSVYFWSGPDDSHFDFDLLCLHWSASNNNSGKFEWLEGPDATPSVDTGPSADHTTGTGIQSSSQDRLGLFLSKIILTP